MRRYRLSIIVILILCTLLVMTLAACDNDSDPASGVPSGNVPSGSTPSGTPAPVDPAEKDTYMTPDLTELKTYNVTSGMSVLEKYSALEAVSGGKQSAAVKETKGSDFILGADFTTLGVYHIGQSAEIGVKLTDGNNELSFCLKLNDDMQDRIVYTDVKEDRVTNTQETVKHFDKAYSDGNYVNIKLIKRGDWAYVTIDDEAMTSYYIRSLLSGDVEAVFYTDNCHGIFSSIKYATDGEYIGEYLEGKDFSDNFDREELLKGYRYSFANPSDVRNDRADDFYFNIEPTADALVIEGVGLGDFTSSEFMMIPIKTKGTDNTTSWILNKTDTVLRVYGSGQVYYKTGYTYLWDWRRVRDTDNTIVNAVSIERNKDYFSFTVTIPYSVIGAEDVDYIEAAFMEFYQNTDDMTIYNGTPNLAMRYDGTPAGDPAIQTNYFTIKIAD